MFGISWDLTGSHTSLYLVNRVSVGILALWYAELRRATYAKSLLLTLDIYISYNLKFLMIGTELDL